MKIRSLLIVCLCLLTPVSVVAEELLSQSYAIENIRYLEVGHAARIELRQGATESLRVEGTADVLARVTVDVKGERLILGVKSKKSRLFNWFGNNDDEVKFVVQVTELSGLQMSGAVHAEVGELEGETLKLDASGATHTRFEGLSYQHLNLEFSGASHAVVKVNALETLELSGSGASKIELNGEATLEKLQLDLSGASKYFGRGLAAEEAEILASGASNIEIGTVEYLEVNASGASNVRYGGQPRIKQNTSGASNINSWED